MTVDASNLRRLAEAATPGPWHVQDSNSWRRIGTDWHDGDVVCPTKQRDGHPDLLAKRDDLDYIAAAHPAAVLALLDERDKLREALREARDGLRYWEPQTTRGVSECRRITALVDAALAATEPGA